MFVFDIIKGWELIKELLIFIIGIVIYSVFIFKFYRFVARKDIIKLNLNQYNNFKHPVLEKISEGILYVLEYIIVFPTVIFIWGAALTILIVLMSNDTSQELFALSLAVVGAIRITAYYNEDLSRDISKLLPFALLGAFIVSSSALNIESLVDVANIAIINWNSLIYYFIFLVILEFILRVWHLITFVSPIDVAEDEQRFEIKKQIEAHFEEQESKIKRAKK